MLVFKKNKKKVVQGLGFKKRSIQNNSNTKTYNIKNTHQLTRENLNYLKQF
jgi:hypothetical protein